MQVTLAALADYINVTPDGKMNIMGVFNQVNAVAFPSSIHDMRLVVKFTFTPAERGQTRMLHIKFLDPDGEELLTFAQPIQIPDSVLTPEVAHIAQLRGVALPRPGEYAFHILMDSDEKAEIPLRVAQVELPSPPAQGG